MSDPVLSVYSDQRKGLFKFLSSLILLEWSHDLLLLTHQFCFLIQALCGHWRLEDNSGISKTMGYLINFNLQNTFRKVCIISCRTILFAPDTGIQYFSCHGSSRANILNKLVMSSLSVEPTDFVYSHKVTGCQNRMLGKAAQQIVWENKPKAEWNYW